jgi:hypothetical protein
MAAVSEVLLTKVVVLGEPFHWTVELAIKLLPLSASVKPEPPAVAVLGLMLPRLGAGLGAWEIVKV